MKKTSLIMLVAMLLAGMCWPAAVLADWSTDSEENNPICTAENDQWYPVLISDGSGGAIITWSDNRSGNHDIYVQRIDASGNVLWANNGVAICTASEDQYYPELVSDSWGGAIVTWMDGRNGNYDIYTQRVNASGNVLWTNDGVAICKASNNQFYPELVSNGSGGAIITWMDRRSGNYDIYAQRVNISGNILWTDNGTAVCTAANNQQYPELVSDNSGGAIVTWVDGRDDLSGDIYAQRIDTSGNVLWTDNGTAICTMTNIQYFPGLVSDDSGGAIITWYDKRSGGNSDIYAQRVDTSGIAQWTDNGTAICTADSEQWYYKLVSDGSGGAIITWEDYRDGATGDIYAQRVDASGIAQWTDNGTAICTDIFDQWLPDLVSDGSGGAIITWEDYRNGIIYGDIYAQRVDASGSTQWTDNGTAICTAPDDQWLPELVSDGSGGAIITWEDYRNGATSDIYAQRVNSSGLPGQPATPETPQVPIWYTETVDSSGIVGMYSSLALDTNGYPHISYYNSSSGYLQYAHYNGAMWYADIVDLTSDVGLYSSLALDGNDNPHISYYDSTNGNLKYASYDGLTWSSDNVDLTGNVGWYSSLALDGNDNPHISYYDSTNGNLKYARYDGSIWSTDNVDSSGDVGWYTSLAIDSNNNPHISYLDLTNGILKYTSYDGLTWSSDNVDFTNDVAFYSSLALDSSDHPHISYSDSDNYYLKYASYDGDTWSSDIVGSTGDLSWYASLAIDSNDNPHITYYHIDNFDLKYASYSGGEWSVETIDSTGSVGLYASLALDGGNYPHISYFDLSNGDLKYTTTSLRKNWEIETVDSSDLVGDYSSLALDANDYPRISYYDEANNDLKYTRYNGTDWDIETVDSTGDVGQWTSLALTGSNYPNISYYDSGNGDLKYTRYNGTDWDIETVDSTGDVGGYTSLALDSSNYPHISYHDETNQDLKYAGYNGIDWDIETVDSTGNIGLWTSLALDSSNYPHISYYDETNQDLKYASYNGTGWSIVTVDSTGDVGKFNSLALDGSNCPRISYFDDTSQNLKFAGYNGTDWLIETVDEGETVEEIPGSAGYCNSLGLDSNNYPHISYFEYTIMSAKAKYAVYNGTDWYIETVDYSGFGGLTSIAVGSDDNPHISYIEAYFQFCSLKYAERSQPFPVYTSTGTGTASFSWSDGLFSSPSSIAEGTLPSEGKPDVSFPHGLFSFKIIELDTGQTVVVTITFPSAVPAGIQYWKYHDPEGWVNVSSLLGDNDGDNILTLTLTDGGLGDDDGTANGVIVDAGGPGITPPAPSPPAVGGGISEYYLRADVNGTRQRFLCEYIGKIEKTGEVISPDEMLKIALPKGTLAKDKNGEGLRRLNVNVNDNPPPPPADNHIIGLAYDFQPDGATFDPPITLTLTYEPENLPIGVAEENLILAYYDENTRTWVNLESAADVKSHTITAEVSHFTNFAVIGKVIPLPASFSVSNLFIQPGEAKPDDIVTITVTVTNTGGMEGKYNLTLSINGVSEETKNVTINVGASERISFALSRQQSGIYKVDVNGLEGSFGIIGPTPATAPSAAPTLKPMPPSEPKPAPTPAPAPTPMPTQAPVLPPAPAPLPPAPPSTNWWLIGGLIGACAVVGLVIWQRLSHRRD